MIVTQGVFKNTNVYGMDFIDKYAGTKTIITNDNYTSKFTNNINTNTSQTSTIMSDDHTYYNIVENCILTNCNIETGRFINCIINGNSGTTIDDRNIINDGYFSGCAFFNYIINNGTFIGCTINDTNEWNNGNLHNDNGIINWTKPWTGVWNSGIFDNPYGWLDGTFNGGIFKCPSGSTVGSWSGGTVNGGTFIGPIFFYNGLVRYGDFDMCTFNDGVFNDGTYNNCWFKGGFINNGYITNSAINGVDNKIVVNDGTIFNCSIDGNTDINGGYFDADYDCSIINANIYNINIINFNIDGGNFYNGNYKDVIFNNGNIYNGVYTNIKGYDSLIIHNGTFRNSIFTGITINDGNFTECESTECIFKYGVYTEGNMLDCTWDDGYWNDGIFTSTLMDSGVSMQSGFNVVAPTTTTTSTTNNSTTTTTSTTSAPTTTTTTTTNVSTITIISVTKNIYDNIDINYNIILPTVYADLSYSTSSVGPYTPLVTLTGNGPRTLGLYTMFPNQIIYFKLTSNDNILDYDIYEYDNTTIATTTTTTTNNLTTTTTTTTTDAHINNYITLHTLYSQVYTDTNCSSSIIDVTYSITSLYPVHTDLTATITGDYVSYNQTCSQFHTQIITSLIIKAGSTGNTIITNGSINRIAFLGVPAINILITGLQPTSDSIYYYHV